jgi:hypothetical protein
MRVSIFDIHRKATWSVKARTMWTKGILNQWRTQKGSHTKKGYTQNIKMQANPKKTCLCLLMQFFPQAFKYIYTTRMGYFIKLGPIHVVLFFAFVFLCWCCYCSSSFLPTIICKLPNYLEVVAFIKFFTD